MTRRRWLGALLALLAGTGLLWVRRDTQPTAWPVTEVVDGDTIKIVYEGREEGVRLIGVDTPETVDPNKPVEPFGYEASQFLHTLLDGRAVRLHRPPDYDLKDRHGRLLGYLERDDGLDVNLEILQQGYSAVYTDYEFDRIDEFRAAEREAQAAHRGIWGDPPPVSDTVWITPTGKKYHRLGCGTLGKERTALTVAEAEARGYGPCGKCLREQ